MPQKPQRGAALGLDCLLQIVEHYRLWASFLEAMWAFEASQLRHQIESHEHRLSKKHPTSKTAVVGVGILTLTVCRVGHNSFIVDRDAIRQQVCTSALLYLHAH
jgi:hypothetical protein